MIQLDALPDSRFRGEVSTIVPTADRSKATVLVKVRFIDKDKRILPEMSAKVAFLSRPAGRDEQTPFTALNPAYVVSRSDRKVVFLIRGRRAIETPVTIGEKRGDMLEVTGGLKAGDKIVANPPAGLKNGAEIEGCRKMTVSQKVHMLRCAASFVTAAYQQVRLIPQDLCALPLELFAKPSGLTGRYK